MFDFAYMALSHGVSHHTRAYPNKEYDRLFSALMNSSVLGFSLTCVVTLTLCSQHFGSHHQSQPQGAFLSRLDDPEVGCQATRQTRETR